MSEYLKLLEQPKPQPVVFPPKVKKGRLSKPSNDIVLSIKYEECLIFALNTALKAYKNKSQPRKKYWREMIEVVGK